DIFLFSKKIIGGRSRCPYCHTTLKWYELIPLFSYCWQMGRCNHCRKRLSFGYPAVELISGLIMIIIPLSLGRLFSFYPYSLPLAISWTVFFFILLLISIIDFRLNIIPDELNLLLALNGLVIAFLASRFFTNLNGSLIGAYAPIFGFHDNIIINRAAALIFALIFFGGLVYFGKGRVMGLGDLKLALGLALAFGWPGILLLTALAFVIGSIVGLILIFTKKKTMKNYLPLAPFLAIGAFLIYGYGPQLLALYFQLFNFRI
ncbi:MAG: prepilin peptidase, partial [Patescibacteria group bacterium]|nr:prepilin peptidase [Patescibacteria group bacterium]